MPPQTPLVKGIDEHFDGFIGMSAEQKRVQAISDIIK